MDLVYRVATAISDEVRAKHHEFLRRGIRDIHTALAFWTPKVNILRDPRWGRGHETHGEDPHLTSRMGVAFVKGLQGDTSDYLEVVATPKHYAVHSGPEALRHSFDARVGGGQPQSRGTAEGRNLLAARFDVTGETAAVDYAVGDVRATSGQCVGGNAVRVGAEPPQGAREVAAHRRPSCATQTPTARLWDSQSAAEHLRRESSRMRECPGEMSWVFIPDRPRDLSDRPLRTGQQFLARCDPQSP